MRMRQRSTGFMTALVLGLHAAGCSEPPGQMLLVIQSDMEMPKDIDRIRIEVTSAGIPRYSTTHEGLGGASGLLFPATLGIVASEDRPNDPVTIRVTAGTANGWKVVREAVTVIPEGRRTMLRVPIHFLCSGSASGDEVTNDTVDATNNCAPGETCVAGSCESAEVEEAALPEYADAEVFGGGATRDDGRCLDVTGCFEGAQFAAYDPASCTIAAPPDVGEINVALLTEHQGMCAGTQCFVALDADSDEGWTASADRIALPKAVCDGKFARNQGVVLAKVSPSCPRKTSAVPTCGPWFRSAIGLPPKAGPTVLAASQAHPVSLALSARENGQQRVVWVSSGSFEQAAPDRPITPITPATVKVWAEESGGIHELSKGSEARGTPRQVSTFGTDVYWTSLLGSGGPGEIRRATLANITATGLGNTGESLFESENVKAPEGIAAFESQDRLFVVWSDFSNNLVGMRENDERRDAQIAAAIPADHEHPYRIHAGGTSVCWVYAGTPGEGNGAVHCRNAENWNHHIIADQQATPRAIGVYSEHVYWANFDSGEIYWARVDGGAAVLAQDTSWRPGGIAVDSSGVYWTDWLGGGVYRYPLNTDATPEMGQTVQKIAEGQSRPGDIKVDGDYLYWVNEGSIYEPTGAIMRLDLVQR
jgi:hypothetical protein